MPRCRWNKRKRKIASRTRRSHRGQLCVNSAPPKSRDDTRLRWKGFARNCFQAQLRHFPSPMFRDLSFFPRRPPRKRRPPSPLLGSNPVAPIWSRVTRTTVPRPTKRSEFQLFPAFPSSWLGALHFPAERETSIEKRGITPRPCSSLICLSVPPLSPRIAVPGNSTVFPASLRFRAPCDDHSSWWSLSILNSIRDSSESAVLLDFRFARRLSFGDD